MADWLLHSSGSETASGIGAGSNVSCGELIGGFLRVTAASGTIPTLVIKIQHSPNNSDWYDVAGTTSNTITTTGLYDVTPNSTVKIADWVRIVWTIGGIANPNFTFTYDISVL